MINPFLNLDTFLVPNNFMCVVDKERKIEVFSSVCDTIICNAIFKHCRNNLLFLFHFESQVYLVSNLIATKYPIIIYRYCKLSLGSTLPSNLFTHWPLNSFFINQVGQVVFPCLSPLNIWNWNFLPCLHSRVIGKWLCSLKSKNPSLLMMTKAS